MVNMLTNFKRNFKMNSETDAIDYLRALVETQGVSVATVSDGWLFTFNKQKLLSLLNGLEDSKHIMIMVKKL
jgi:hypothetical protein